MPGIDCPGCAWPEPDPGKRHINQYCENGAKHINDEATTRRIAREFFWRYPVSELAGMSHMWLNHQGRLTEPVVKRPGSDYYEPIGWNEAFDLLAAELHNSTRPMRRCSTHRAG
jgi:anaerobic selenocysteine-containing dehydrogenase